MLNNVIFCAMGKKSNKYAKYVGMEAIKQLKKQEMRQKNWNCNTIYLIRPKRIGKINIPIFEAS